MGKRGKFIVVDGCDGAGKTTMINHAATQFLPGRVVPNHLGDTAFGRSVVSLSLETNREGKLEDPDVLFSLMWAGHHKRMLEAYAKFCTVGQTVLVDRFDSSTFAYQVRGQQAPHLKRLFFETRKVMMRDFAPDLYIILDVDPAVGIKRKEASETAPSSFERQSLDFHKRVRKGYLEFCKHVPHKVIDADKPMEEVKKEFVRVIGEFLEA